MNARKNDCFVDIDVNFKGSNIWTFGYFCREVKTVWGLFFALTTKRNILVIYLKQDEEAQIAEKHRASAISLVPF